MRKIYKAYAVYQRKNISGITFLRDAIRWFDNRPEPNNESKGPVRLLMDFADYTLYIEKQFEKPKTK